MRTRTTASEYSPPREAAAFSSARPRAREFYQRITESASGGEAEKPGGAEPDPGAAASDAPSDNGRGAEDFEAWGAGRMARKTTTWRVPRPRRQARESAENLVAGVLSVNVAGRIGA